MQQHFGVDVPESVNETGTRHDRMPCQAGKPLSISVRLIFIIPIDIVDFILRGEESQHPKQH
jgi:hypothetical protein